MTCDQFARALDPLLAGARPRGLDPPALRHVQQCPPCRRRWARARRLVQLCDAEANDGPAPAVVRKARRRLDRSLAERGRPAVRYDWLRTPVGIVFVSVSERGVCDVTFDATQLDQYLTRLARWATDLEHDPRAVAPTLEQIEAYFSGERHRFSVPVDLRRTSPFTSRVLTATRQIPFGRVVSYGEIASRIGVPTASRAVGGALGRNPVPIIVPCHRVIARARHLGGFTGGLAVKRALLQIEGHTVPAGATMVG